MRLSLIFVALVSLAAMAKAQKLNAVAFKL